MQHNETTLFSNGRMGHNETALFPNSRLKRNETTPFPNSRMRPLRLKQTALLGTLEKGSLQKTGRFVFFK